MSTVREQQYFSKINSNQLHHIMDDLDIPFANLNRILIKQNATSIASASSAHLLAYVRMTPSCMLKCCIICHFPP
mgnify:CR=1 FL=1